MSDQCKHCTHRGNYEACMAETCFRHESWIDLERIQRIQALEKDALEMAKVLLRIHQSWESPKVINVTPFYNSETWQRWGPRAEKEQE